MFQELSVAVTAYRMASRRFGTLGSLAAAGLALLAVRYLQGYLRREHPDAAERLDVAA